MKNCFFTIYIIITFAVAAIASANPSDRTLTLKGGWLIQSSERVTVSGAKVSTASYVPISWYKATVPSTVLGNLVADGVFKNPFQGRNLSKISQSLFDKPWWYRTTFSLPNEARNVNHVTLKFFGVNYKADIWLNGKLIATGDSVFGGFRQFEFDVTKAARFGSANVLAVEISKPEPGSLTIGFVDWSPEPPDHDMGLWRPVEVHLSGDVSIGYPFVASKVDTATLKEAELTVSAELKNRSDHDVTGVLEGKIGSISFSQEVSMSSYEKKVITFSPADFHQLVIKNPRLWWTHDFGKPELYSLRLEFRSNDLITDSNNITFGIRQVNDYINSEGFRGYKLNGKNILIRGGGWVDHIFLDQNEQNLEDQIDYAVNMNLNAIRMEGFWGESSDIYRLCDEKGILIMVGISCQWEWKNIFGGDAEDQYGCIISPEDIATAAKSFRDQVKWLRNHPSIFLWLYGSDKFPRPELEKKYLGILGAYDSTRPFLSSAAEHTSSLTGPSAVKMRGPYDYVPPIYWFADTSNGGAFGFNTETGPGPQIPRVGSLEKMLSPDSLWPINGEWYYHCAKGGFHNLAIYDSAIDARLGKPLSLNDYERKAQFTNYEAMRSMFEAFGANKFKATGVIQWMYNAAWPKMWWQFYDYYLNPTGAFYGAQKACEPIHVEYNPADNGIVVVNSTLEASNALRLKATVLDFNLKNSLSFDDTINIFANTSDEIAKIPKIDSLSRTYFLDLKLYDYENNKPISSNFYALSTRQDSLHWKKSTWYVTERLLCRSYRTQ